jgi:16S rRNA (guanine527-N7)-methyltransferase
VTGARVHLIESDTRKASFLREAARITRAPARVHAERVESVAKRIGAVDAVTARAFAPLGKLLDLAEPLLEREARGFFLRGQDVDNELTDAAKSWKIQSTLLPSRTDRNGKILIIEQATRAR